MALQTAIKITIACLVAWVTMQFLGFPQSYLACILAGISTLAGLGTGWYLLTRGSLAFGIAVFFGALQALLWGNNYITIFVTILYIGWIWNYLQIHGFSGNFMGIMIKLSIIVVHSNSTDPVTFSFYLLCNYYIGTLVGVIVNSLFWPNLNKKGLQQQLREIKSNSIKLTQNIFDGYLYGNLDDTEAQKLRANILTSIQASQKLFNTGTTDPSSRLLGTVDWMAVIHTEQNIYLHLSALLRLVESSKGVTLPDKIVANMNVLSESIINAFDRIEYAIIDRSFAFNSCQIDDEFCQLKKMIKNLRTTDTMMNLPLSERLKFYAIFHRLEKLVDEINCWGIYNPKEREVKSV